MIARPPASPRSAATPPRLTPGLTALAALAALAPLLAGPALAASAPRDATSDATSGAPGTRAQDPAPRACDPRQVPWVLPADFERAVARARDERRVLLVKGVSFGIDGLGATCGHKGRW